MYEYASVDQSEQLRQQADLQEQQRKAREETERKTREEEQKLKLKTETEQKLKGVRDKMFEATGIKILEGETDSVAHMEYQGQKIKWVKGEGRIRFENLINNTPTDFYFFKNAETMEDWSKLQAHDSGALLKEKLDFAMSIVSQVEPNLKGSPVGEPYSIYLDSSRPDKFILNLHGEDTEFALNARPSLPGLEKPLEPEKPEAKKIETTKPTQPESPVNPEEKKSEEKKPEGKKAPAEDPAKDNEEKEKPKKAWGLDLFGKKETPEAAEKKADVPTFERLETGRTFDRNNDASLDQCSEYINKVFKKYHETVVADRKEYSGYSVWQAYSHECEQLMQQYAELTLNGYPEGEQFAATLKVVDTMATDLNKYQEERATFPKSSPETVATVVESDVEQMQKFDWEKGMAEIKPRVEANMKKFQSIRKTWLYDRYRTTMNNYIDAYTTLFNEKDASGKPLRQDNRTIQAVVWEWKKALDAYEPELQNVLDGKAKGEDPHATVTSQLSSFSLFKDVGTSWKFSEDMTNVDIRKEMLAHTNENASDIPDAQTLLALCRWKAWLPVVGGALMPGESSVHLNRADMDAIAQALAIDNWNNNPWRIYEGALKQQGIDPRSEDAYGLRIMLGIATPAERAKFNADQAKLAKGNKLANNRPFIFGMLNLVTGGKIGSKLANGNYKNNQFHAGNRDLRAGVFATARGEVKKGMDEGHVGFTDQVDSSPRPGVTEDAMTRLQVAGDVMKKGALSQMKEVMNQTNRDISTVAVFGPSLNTFEWLLKAANSPVPMKGIPSGGIIWIEDVKPKTAKEEEKKGPVTTPQVAKVGGEEE